MSREWDVLPFLYQTAAGRMVLKVLTARWISKAAGVFCDSACSRPLIKGFVKKNQINLSEYKKRHFSSFNDCFTREIKPECRPICSDASALIAPCDGLLSVYKIEQASVFPVKQTAYTLESLLKNRELAQEFEGGMLLVFRLCVHHYHRYCYLDSGRKGENIFLDGKLHTVRPIALENVAVFSENCREYTVMETENFGKVIQCEVGAMLVGRIQNHDGACEIQRGTEKGMFLYGGSTVLVMLKKGAAELPELFWENTSKNIETPVKYGEKIGDTTNA